MTAKDKILIGVLGIVMVFFCAAQCDTSAAQMTFFYLTSACPIMFIIGFISLFFGGEWILFGLKLIGISLLTGLVGLSACTNMSFTH